MPILQPEESGNISDTGIETFTQKWWVRAEEGRSVIRTCGFPFVDGVPMKNRSWKNQSKPGGEVSGWIVTCNYEGKTANADEVAGEENPVWNLDRSFKEERIEAHPKIQQLLAFYGGALDAEGKARWPEEIPEEAKKKRKRRTFRDSGPQANPMFGVETFLQTGAVATRRWLVDVIDQRLLDQEGRVTQHLPTDKFPTPENRDWFIMPIKADQKGEGFEVSQSFVLGPEGGWPPEVYGLIER